MVSTFLVSTAVTGALLLGVAVFLRKLRQWRDDKPDDGRSGFDALGSLVGSPTAWAGVYVVFILIAAAATYGYVAGGAGVSESLANTSLLVLGGAFAVAIMAFVAGGTYTAVRGNGRSSSQAAGMGLVAVGLVVLAAVAVKLVAA